LKSILSMATSSTKFSTKRPNGFRISWCWQRRDIGIFSTRFAEAQPNACFERRAVRSSPFQH